jgi:alginate O-acetyltransferase complex protein AlgI
LVFSSQVFLFWFLPTALLLYYASPRPLRHLSLTVLSYAFYGWANPAFMLLMLLSTLIDYAVGLAMTGHFQLETWKKPAPILAGGLPRTRFQKFVLTVSIISNLSLLGFFKYFNFAVDNYNSLVSVLGLSGAQLELGLRIILPLGISFYTFQSISYSIDVYRGEARVLRNFVDFACYVSMFPQLVAGPIIRFQDVADQMLERTHTLEKFARGTAFVCFGMAKKILLANPCGKIADTVFGASHVGFLDSWYGAIAYGFQIYFDFSGYSDMAIGLGLMLGFVFPKNFDSPYISASITEFWRRWHISLSTWLRDYLYIPLGGNRGKNWLTYRNLMLVMLLGGLWHGAAWNFVIWGVIHGLMLAFERMRNKTSPWERMARPVRVAFTFIIVTFAWVFFRAETLTFALDYCQSMIGLGPAQGSAALIAGLIYQPYYVVSMLACAAIVWLSPTTWDFTRRLTLATASLAVLLLVMAVAFLTTQEYNPFIYFIF